MVTEAERAYAAGFLDGEGSFYINLYFRPRRGHWQKVAKVCVSQNDPRPLEWLIERWGGQLRRARHVKLSTGIYWQYQLPARKATRLVEDVLPFLLVKREVAENFLAFESYRPQSRKLSDDDLSHLYELVNRSHILNGRPAAVCVNHWVKGVPI
jgi:hypothetical protein